MGEVIITILVIEDEEILRESLADYLEDRDFRVVTAENGRVGLELFARESPDLILTDLRMPEMDGLEVLRRAGELSPETPLIVVSGTGNISDSIQALQFGAWDYILKPVEDMSLISLAVDKALERVRLRRENSAYQENLEALVRERTGDLEQANTHLTHINARLRSVVETTRRLSVCTDVARFGVTLLNEFAHHMAAPGGSSFLLEDTGLRRLAALEPDHVPEFIPFPLPDDSLLRRVIEGKQPLLIHNIAQEHGVTSSGWDENRGGSALIFPLSDDTGCVVGVITRHSKTSAPFVEQDKDIGDILASYSTTIRIDYSDNGKGIVEEQLPRIFDPFYTTTRSQGGTGLGLHIVYNLVTQRLNGRIHCESAPGQGTVFHMTIPRIVDNQETWKGDNHE